MRLPVLVGLVLALLLCVLVAFANLAGMSLEVFAVLLLIALLVVRELVSAASTTEFRGRYDVFVWSGLGVFLLIVVNRVREILGL